MCFYVSVALFMQFDTACDTQYDHVCFAYNRYLVTNLIAHLWIGRRKVKETFFLISPMPIGQVQICETILPTSSAVMSLGALWIVVRVSLKSKRTILISVAGPSQPGSMQTVSCTEIRL